MKKVRLVLPMLILGLLAAAAGQAQTISIVSGNGQVICPLCFGISTSSFQPLVVKVVNNFGQPVPNATVNWALVSGSGSLNVSSTTTDQNGLSSNTFFLTAPFVNLFNEPFRQGVVSASTGSTSVQFTETLALTSQGGVGSNISTNVLQGLGTQIIGQAGQVFPTPFQVQVATSLGLPVAGVSVSLVNDTDDPNKPSVSCVSDAGQAPGVVLTDATGVANCRLMFGPKIGSDGSFHVVAGGGYFNTGSIFFQVTAGVAGKITAFRGNNQSPGADGTLPSPLVAVVSDAGGNPLENVAVTWTANPASAATFTNQHNTSAVDGQVSTNVKVTAATGPFQVLVAIANNPAVSTTFSVSAPQVSISSLTKVSGDAQDAGQNSAFSAPLVVQVAGGALAGVPVSFTVTSGSATLSSSSAVTDAQGRAQVTVNAGQNTGPVTVVASSGAFNVTFNLTVRPPGPSFTSDSFFNAASQEQGALSPCSLATIKAGGITSGIQGTVSPIGFGPAPFILGSSKVTIGDRPAPILSGSTVGGESLTIQVPCDVTPATSVPVTINVGGGSKTGTVQVKVASPGIFENVNSDGKSRATLVRPDGSFVDAVNNPARRGEVVRLYATGLGATAPSVSTGQLGIPDIDSPVLGTVIVGVNNSGARVVSAKVARNLIGVYEVAFEVPSDAPVNQDVVLSVAVNPVGGGPTLFSRASHIPIQ